MRFIDPCIPEDDHNLHWRSLPDGSLEGITPAGAYTIERLQLWRDQLKFHRARLYRWQQQRDDLVQLLANKKMSSELRVQMEKQIVVLNELLEPPKFDRPHGR